MVYDALDGLAGIERFEGFVVARGMNAVAEEDVNQIVLFVDPKACAGESGVAHNALWRSFAAGRQA